jgi:N-ethylmaleimide reductase
MAPLTRCRADDMDCPRDIHAIYYEQRASAGLIISEASQISQQGKGYAHTPGIYTKEQIEHWRAVTNAVHQHDGKIFCQLWHVGRISHPDLQPEHQLPVAPSAIKPEGKALTNSGLKPFVTPRALETHEISGIVEQYAHAAQCAKSAGFDGVEIHAANGYLLDQFIRSGTNLRTDIYGGSIQNRIRIIIEVIEAILKIWPSHRVGIRLSPVSTFNNMFDESPFITFSTLIEAINPYHLAYIHCIEGTARDKRPESDEFDFIKLRKQFTGLYIANNLYDKKLAIDAVEQNRADLICFGRAFIANPDLVYRLEHDVALTDAPIETWYGGDEKGYTDWPKCFI